MPVPVGHAWLIVSSGVLPFLSTWKARKSLRAWRGWSVSPGALSLDHTAAESQALSGQGCPAPSGAFPPDRLGDSVALRCLLETPACYIFPHLVALNFPVSSQVGCVFFIWHHLDFAFI